MEDLPRPLISDFRLIVFWYPFNLKCWVSRLSSDVSFHVMVETFESLCVSSLVWSPLGIPWFPSVAMSAQSLRVFLRIVGGPVSIWIDGESLRVRLPKLSFRRWGFFRFRFPYKGVPKYRLYYQGCPGDLICAVGVPSTFSLLLLWSEPLFLPR